MMNTEDTVAVAARVFAQNPELQEVLEQKYSRVKYNETGQPFNKAELIEFLRGCSKAIISLERLDNEVLAEVPELKSISKYGVGLDNIDFKALIDHRVKVGWKGGVNRRSVAELALSMMLVLVRHTLPAHLNMRNGIWERTVGDQLSRKTVGIIGCGHIGKDLIRLLKPFDSQVLAYDIIDQTDYYKQESVESLGIDDLLAAADIVTVHCPLTPLTRNILDHKALSLMKKGAIVINTARGGIIDEQALVSLLKSGHLGGAGLDVFVKEPQLRTELVDLPNVFSTPHIGGTSKEAIYAMGIAAIEGLSQAVDPEEFAAFVD